MSIHHSPDNPELKYVTVEHADPKVILHANKDVDLAAIWLPPYVTEINALGGLIPHAVFLSKEEVLSHELIDDLTAVEPIYMVGYPAGLIDAANNSPIVRKGITATPAYLDFQGRNEFVIDCACFKGSSGSPVFIRRENPYFKRSTGELFFAKEPPFGLAGILYGGPLIMESGKVIAPDGTIPNEDNVLTKNAMGLGWCIKSEEIEAMKPAAEKTVADNFVFDK